MNTILNWKRYLYLARVGTLLIAVVLIAGMVAGCEDGGGVEYDLTINSTAGGSVTDPGEDTFTYDEGAEVALVATPDAGYRFGEWTGDVGTVDDVEDATTAITMNDNYEITAEFIRQYELSIDCTAGGNVTTPGEGTSTYDEATVVDLVATPDTDYHFVEWTGDVVDIAHVEDATTNIVMNDDYTITANFAPGIAVRDWYDLDAIRDNLSGNYTLMHGLDSTTAGYEELASAVANDSKGWQPIGTDGNRFTGNFHGQGHEISDLLINRPAENYAGLFGYVGAGGVVQNVGVVNVDVTGLHYVGGLAGGNAGTLSNSHSTGSVIGNTGVGGLLGRNYEGQVSNSYSSGNATGNNAVGGLLGQTYHSQVSNSYSTGSVTGSTVVGGLVGSNDGGTIGTMSNCHFTGTVTSTGSYVGGLVGRNVGGTMSNCHFTGTVTSTGSYVGGLFGWNEHSHVSNSHSSGNVTGNDCVGGLVGWNRVFTTEVSNSYSSGSVTGNDYIGGLVGRNDDGQINDSYSTGSVGGSDNVGGLVGQNDHGQVIDSYSSSSVTGTVRVGGLVGYNYDTATVLDSYSRGSVTGSGLVGGLIGDNYDSAVITSFWDTETSGQASSDGGTPKNTLQMKDIATFSSYWDIVAVGDPGERDPGHTWNIVDDVTYPFLSWEPV